MLAGLSFFEQFILVLAALVLFLSFAMLGQTRLLIMIKTFAWQGGLLALTTALVAAVSGHQHLYVSAALTLILKAILIPWMLHRLMLKLNVPHTEDPMGHTSIVLLAGAALVLFSYSVSAPVIELSSHVTRNTLAISVAVVLVGMLLMTTRRTAMAQVVGFMSIENGLFFAAVAATYGMPLIIELGIAFDVLVAAVIFGVFFFRIRDSIDTLDVDRMNRLTEVDE